MCLLTFAVESLFFKNSSEMYVFVCNMQKYLYNSFLCNLKMYLLYLYGKQL